jgi:hypothetical protein
VLAAAAIIVLAVAVITTGKRPTPVQSADVEGSATADRGRTRAARRNAA